MMNYNDQQNSSLPPPTSMNYGSAEQQRSFQNSMVELWNVMSRLYHPQWSRTNGEIGGGVFQDWTRELLPYGSQGVLRGIQSVRDGGNVYPPVLNKFLSECRAGGESSGGSVDVFGRRLKPTPNGLPLTWTIGTYSIHELRASGLFEDATVADSLERRGLTHWTYIPGPQT